MNQEIALENAQVPAQLRGGYTGKKFEAVVTQSVTIPFSAGNWSGGSRDTYRLVNIETGESMAASDDMSAPWDRQRKDRTVELRPGFAVIRHTIFCGKDLGLTFFVHPDNAAKLLPAPMELTMLEKAILIATRQFKSSYMGRDRYDMMRDDCRYPAGPFPTRAEWDSAKADLITKGMLNKAGAITVKGRNAIGNERL